MVSVVDKANAIRALAMDAVQQASSGHYTGKQFYTANKTKLS